MESLFPNHFYLVTSGKDAHTVEVARAAAAAGADMIQVREKEASTRELLELVREVSLAVQATNSNTKVVVDDRVDVAYAARFQGLPVHGAHIGQDDIPVRAAREILGKDAILGLTTGNRELVESANQVADFIDYVGAGPFRPTPTKNSGREPLGVAGYPELAQLSLVPVVAIGDIQLSDVPALSTTGIAAVAMVRAIMQSETPGADVAKAISSWRNNPVDSRGN